jgi:hypothetical protein
MGFNSAFKGLRGLLGNNARDRSGVFASSYEDAGRNYGRYKTDGVRIT